MALLKYSAVENGVTWWFLYELEEGRPRARFLKRFGSEEELDLEAAAKYGESPADGVREICVALSGVASKRMV